MGGADKGIPGLGGTPYGEGSPNQQWVRQVGLLGKGSSHLQPSFGEQGKASPITIPPPFSLSGPGEHP